MHRLSTVILAAGQGTRLKSKLNKVLHPVCGRPMVDWSVAAARAIGSDQIVLVVGNDADAVREHVGQGVTFVLQEQRLGTAHAVMQAQKAVEDFGANSVLVFYGDMPALRAETLAALVARQRESDAVFALLSVIAEDPMGFGRVVRDAKGKVQAIVEEAAASPEVLAIRELNCGVYCFDADWLWENIQRIEPTPPKNEYYLPDVVDLAASAGESIKVVCIDDVEEIQGVNNRVHLAECTRILHKRINQEHMLNGVSITDPTSTYIDVDVVIGRDTVIYPNTHLRAGTVIGEDCSIGPNTIIEGSIIGDGCTVLSSMLEGARMDDGANIGPFGHLRKGAHLGEGVHMGNFGEVKNSYLAPGTKMGHFSYLGDAQVGEDVNIGAGTITCNYDGVNKHPTVIGRDAFIGSGSLIVAPAQIGERAKLGAGSVVTHPVGDDMLAYGQPAREIRKMERVDEDQD